MDAQDFYLCFGASYVLICQLELKLLKYNYKKFVQFGVCFVADYCLGSHDIIFNAYRWMPKIFTFVWCKLCGYMSLRSEVIEIHIQKFCSV